MVRAQHRLFTCAAPDFRCAAAGAASAARSSGTGPAETGYYEALGVPHTATQAEIKRSYYLLARQLVRMRRMSTSHASSVDLG